MGGTTDEEGSMRRGWLRSAILLVATILGSPVLAQRVLVFPLDQTAGPVSSAWIGTGLAVALNEALVSGGVSCIPAEDLQKVFEQEGLVRNPTFAAPSQVALARQLGASSVIRGSYAVEERSLKVHLEAYEVAGDVRLLGKWDETRDIDGLLDVTVRLAQSLFAAMGKPWLGYTPAPPPAFESYIRGRIALDPTLEEVFLRKALEISPDYAEAACYLAMVLQESGRTTEATGLLVPLEKRPFAKAYLALATLASIRLDEGRLQEAQRLLVASLKAAENPEAHIGLARLYLRQKRYAETLRELVVAERFGTHQEEIEALRAQATVSMRSLNHHHQPVLASNPVTQS
jgi:hypothetical protein